MQSVIFEIEIATAPLEGSAVAFVVPQIRQALVDLLAAGQLLQVAKGDAVLGLNPLAAFGRLGVFQPAVGIGDFYPVVNVYLTAFGAFRVGQGS